MSTIVLQSSNALALKTEPMTTNNNNDNIADYSSTLRQQSQFFIEEKNNKSFATAISSPNMFQENEEEEIIINNSDIEEFEELNYDNNNNNNNNEYYCEAAEGLGIKLNNGDNNNLDEEEGENINEEEKEDYKDNINDINDKINNNLNNQNEKTKKNQAPHFEYVSYDKVQDLYEQRKGHFYFIPEGFEPVLVPNDTKAQTVTNLLESAKPVSAAPNVSRMLPDTDVRLPSYALPCGVNANSKKENANANKANSKPKKTPRPPNAFILYRRAKQPVIVAKNAGISNNDVSKEIGKMWHEETVEVKLKYQKLAEKAKEEHAKRFPEYKYRPRRPQDKKRHHAPMPAAGTQEMEGKTKHVGKNVNDDNLYTNNVDDNFDNGDNNNDDDLYYNNNESFYNNNDNNNYQNQQYQLMSLPPQAQQIFYQNQMNSISPIDSFSMIGDTDIVNNDVDDDSKNSQFTAYLQNTNDFDLSLFQEFPQNFDFDFYSLQ